jgi:hypothetical protein
VTDADPLPRPRYEPRDAEPRVIAATAAVLAAVIATCIAVGVFAYGSGRRAAQSRSGAAGLFQNGVHQETSVEETWNDMARARSNLSGYAWVDRKAGVVRIPIERAIDLVCSGQTSAPEAPGTGGGVR